MIFLRSIIKHNLNTSLCLRRLASGTVADLKMNPDLYNGILTKFGWVLVKKSHVARGWTQSLLNKELDNKLGNVSEKPDWEVVQKIADEWAETADISQIPQISKRTGAQVNKDNEMRLYLQQVRYEEPTEESEGAEDSEDPNIQSAKRELKTYKKINKEAVTFTNAWNYYMTVNYNKYSALPSKEARQKVGTDWRQLSLDEKEYFRQEYGKLLNLGKDILHGKIVDKEVKELASKKLWESKERTRLRKLGVLPPADRRKL